MGVLEKVSTGHHSISQGLSNIKLEHRSRRLKRKRTLKAKLAKYRAQLLEPDKKSAKGEGFDVLKSGDARVALIGFPSVGKSTLLSKVTKTESITGAYEFTTLTAIPGVLEYEGARVQLLDLPGIVEGAAMGRGRGRQVTEYEGAGCRIQAESSRRSSPYQSQQINATVKLTKIDEKMIRSILQSYKIHNCDVMIREDIDTDEFIDVLLGTRKYVPCLYVFNKIDSVSLEEVERLSTANEGKNVMISCEMDLGLDILLERIWEELRLVNIHRGLASHFKYALVWGKSSKFSPQPQKVGLTHPVTDEDVVSIFTK
ncbi:hypothetical protein QFC20_002317 [Naganishia adeliensis]|uniref:Uncharacterized protein n=1 Tax=Naganishia adeliensis TaxID=92952 RepID=A0ACC2WMV6_9TREE|nr:hypothetical protein QFC20_002317 [Naganishia adeliensis]